MKENQFETDSIRDLTTEEMRVTRGGLEAQTQADVSIAGRLATLHTAAAWEMDDFGGTGRVMPDATILVDGKILFVN